MLGGGCHGRGLGWWSPSLDRPACCGSAPTSAVARGARCARALRQGRASLRRSLAVAAGSGRQRLPVAGLASAGRVASAAAAPRGWAAVPVRL
ncbi:hypothetical protein BU14_2969s0001 [Porphyra umbilicalis]|uniref:Uncharacterized protein n=1 Tax=Porphyra umbilicalis TaxID=2786 RepID=A0A1X6NIF8_PORUM|nr:hypothetical protein BU14_2969s0001 [Porphyra umbilicalis]|eukprot:OSX68342.1 hypothetical protein BU14_2969s0001 [Porphyra umbilicalis]